VQSQISKVNIREAPSNVNVSVSIGATAPTTIEQYWAPVPAEIVEIVPAWRSYRVVRISGRLVIIEPSSRRIVYIIEA